MTNTGNSRFAGKAARNCATGWIFCAKRGRRPIITPSGTQISEAIRIKPVTRSRVIKPSTNTWPTSAKVTSVPTYITMWYSA